jgi:succinate dehydrogenase / fumarate reductase cytochrome b subunit
MQKLIQFINSGIGSKILIAVSGALIILFLLFHALGNLLIFSGQNTINIYAHWLQHSPFLWVFRTLMISLLSLHVFLAIRANLQNRTARPITYFVNKEIQLKYSSKTMIFSGLIIFIFIFFHISHLTLGWVSTTSFEILDQNQHIDVYTNIIRGFKQPAISFFYIFSILIIGLHLHHAIKSLFQTLGFHHENFHKLLDYLSPFLIIALVLAFISIPFAVMVGILQ